MSTPMAPTNPIVNQNKKIIFLNILFKNQEKSAQSTPLKNSNTH